MKTRKLIFSFGLLSAFAAWTAALRFADVQAIGPNGSAVGLATLNGFFHNLTGVHMSLYVITDWLGLIPLGTAVGFAVLGLAQWIRRKNILRVDHSILTLGGFYLLVLAAFLFFEDYHVNYRPVLINGAMEVSYPSSTTLLVLCVMPTLNFQVGKIDNRYIRSVIKILSVIFSAFMVGGRLISGVHWLSDIIGSVLFSFGLFCIYKGVSVWSLEKNCRN